MQAALSTPELVSLIVDQIKPEGPETIYKHDTARLRTLAHLARACRAFQNASLDALWCEVRSITHLIKCLPEDLWTLNEDEERSRLVSCLITQVGDGRCI
jgi:hypothetical protein